MNLDLVLILTIVGTGITVIGFIYGFLRNLKTDLEIDIQRLDSELKGLSNKYEEGMKAQTIRTDQLNARTDQLYQMFIDLLKSQSPKSNP